MRLLMHRMDEAEKRMKTEAGTDSALTSRKDMVTHEAALMATIAKIVTLPGYGYEDDPKFKGYANDVVQAVARHQGSSRKQRLCHLRTFTYQGIDVVQ